MADSHRKAIRRGKHFEWEVATELNTQRVLKKGTSVPDLVHPEFNIDCKKRERLSVYAAVEEAEKKYGKPVVIIWGKPGTGTRDSLVVMRLEDCKEWLKARK